MCKSKNKYSLTILTYCDDRSIPSLQFILLLLITSGPYKLAKLTHCSVSIKEAISCSSDTTIEHLFAIDKCNKMHISSKVFNPKLKLECSTAIGICLSLPDETSTLCTLRPEVLLKLPCYSIVFVFSPIAKISIKCSSQCGWLVDQMYEHLKACTSCAIIISKAMSYQLKN